MSLAKWGRRHDYFASDLGSGVPISRGSPYRSYTGKIIIQIYIGIRRQGAGLGFRKSTPFYMGRQSFHPIPCGSRDRRARN